MANRFLNPPRASATFALPVSVGTHVLKATPLTLRRTHPWKKAYVQWDPGRRVGTVVEESPESPVDALKGAAKEDLLHVRR